MIRAGIAFLVLCVLVLYAPLWAQLTAFSAAVVFVRPRALWLLPAMLADAWYAPVRTLAPAHNKLTLLVVGALLVYSAIVRFTRVGARYGLETK